MLLTLNAVKKCDVYGDIPNILMQKWPAPEFSIETKLGLSNLNPGDEAGMISMGMEYGLVSFVRTEKDFRIIRVHGRQIFGKILVDHTEEEMEEIGSADLFPVNFRRLRT